MKILLLGSSGMLGHTLFNDFFCNRKFDTYGTVRNISEVQDCFPQEMLDRVIEDIDANNINSVEVLINKLRPDIVINCIGIIKQLPIAKEPLPVIALNSLFPHQVAAICKDNGCRMIHVSTDCVFDGSKGEYTEEDFLSANDLYGISKFMGEVNYNNTITVRTSIIGHELTTNLSLIDWFLSQKGSVNGFKNAIYTGFPTIEIAKIISEYIIPNEKLQGLYHVSSNPISKYELLKLVSKIYKKEIKINPYEDYIDHKSLISKKFRSESGYEPPEWDVLIKKMYDNFNQFGYKRNI